MVPVSHETSRHEPRGSTPSTDRTRPNRQIAGLPVPNVEDG